MLKLTVTRVEEFKDLDAAKKFVDTLPIEALSPIEPSDVTLNGFIGDDDNLLADYINSKKAE